MTVTAHDHPTDRRPLTSPRSRRGTSTCATSPRCPGRLPRACPTRTPHARQRRPPEPGGHPSCSTRTGPGARIRPLPPPLRLRRLLPEQLRRPGGRPARAREAVRLHRPRPAEPAPPDRRAHDEQLDVLVPAADALITLTPGAARGDRAALGPQRGRRAASARRRPRDARGCCRRGPPDAAPPLPGGGPREEPAREHGPAAGPRPRWSRPSPAWRVPCSGSTCTPRRPGRRAAPATTESLAACAPGRSTTGARSSCTCTTTSPTTSSGTTWRRSTSRCCPTGSAPTPAGWRRATTCGRRCWRRPAATSPSSGPCLSYRARRGRASTPLPCGRRVRAGARRSDPALGGRRSTGASRQQRADARGRRTTRPLPIRCSSR